VLGLTAKHEKPVLREIVFTILFVFPSIIERAAEDIPTIYTRFETGLTAIDQSIKLSGIVFKDYKPPSPLGL